jgi:hypothetical protein
MCNNIENAAGFKVGDTVYLTDDTRSKRPMRVTAHGHDYVDLEDESTGAWEAAWNSEVRRASLENVVKAANGIGPGAGPGARLAATLRALGKKLKS